jgi:hypothetical protein
MNHISSAKEFLLKVGYNLGTYMREGVYEL